MFGVIYFAQCGITGKGYVGQTITTVAKRWLKHTCEQATAIDRAIAKYGKQNFHVSVICEATSRTELDALEITWIRLLNTKTPHGYNLTDGGGGTSGWTATDQQRANFREGKRLHPMSDAGRKAVSAAQTWRVVSPETGARISASKKGKKHAQPMSAEHRQKLSIAKQGQQPFLGHKHTEETIAHLREINLGRIITPEHRANIRAARLGTKASDTARANMSAAHLRRHAIARGLDV